jgi:hypothetical protein
LMNRKAIKECNQILKKSMLWWQYLYEYKDNCRMNFQT